MLYDELVAAALESGLTKAEVIDGESVVVDESFRAVCRSNQCGFFGRNWACPGDMNDIRERMDEVKSFPHCLIYQVIGTLEDSFDVEGMEETGLKLSQGSHILDGKLRKMLKAPYLHLTGACRLCEKCARISAEPCRNPDKLLRSISGYGIDVNKTTQSSSLKYINGQNTVTNFGMVFFTE